MNRFVRRVADKLPTVDWCRTGRCATAPVSHSSIRRRSPDRAGLCTHAFDESRYFRFFNAIRDLAKRLTRFTQIEYDREMALIAVVCENGRERKSA